MEPLQQALDTDLIRAFQEGNQQALETLINRYKEKIFSSIFFLVKDKYLAEDLFQEVFIKVIDTLRSNRYNEEGKFLQWALRISHNLCVDYFRKIKRTKIVYSGDDKDIFEVINVNSESADTKMVQGQSHDKIRSMLEQLPEEQREVIILRHYADMSFKEIADVFNESINTVKSRYRRTLATLRKNIKKN